jgi:hypothetical protein
MLVAFVKEPISRRPENQCIATSDGHLRFTLVTAALIESARGRVIFYGRSAPTTIPICSFAVYNTSATSDAASELKIQENSGRHATRVKRLLAFPSRESRTGTSLLKYDE